MLRPGPLLPDTLPPGSHGQRLELCVADPRTESGLDQLQIALTDLIFTTALLQEVDLRRGFRRKSFLRLRSDMSVTKAHGYIREAQD